MVIPIVEFMVLSGQPAREDELGFLKNEAQSLNNELKALEARIQALETQS